MKITRNKKAFNDFTITELTEGKLMAMWCAMEHIRKERGLTGVEYDCWLQLNRTMEDLNIPVGIHA